VSTVELLLARGADKESTVCEWAPLVVANKKPTVLSEYYRLVLQAGEYSMQLAYDDIKGRTDSYTSDASEASEACAVSTLADGISRWYGRMIIWYYKRERAQGSECLEEESDCDLNAQAGRMDM
jgi:hypothetical protein